MELCHKETTGPHGIELQGRRVNNGVKATELLPKDETARDEGPRDEDGMCVKKDSHHAIVLDERGASGPIRRSRD